MYKILICFSITITGFQQLFPVIVRGEIWRRKREDSTYCYLYNMYDVHISYIPGLPEKIRQQIKDLGDLILHGQYQYMTLVSAFKTILSNDIKILVEDSSAYQNGTSVFPSEFIKLLAKIHGSDQSIELLHAISSRLKTDGISSIINIDYRQKRSAAIAYDKLMVEAINLSHRINSQSADAQIIQQLYTLKDNGLNIKNIQPYDSVLNITMEELLKEFDNASNSAQKYQDGPILRSYYMRQIKQIHSQSKAMYKKMSKNHAKKYRSFAISFGENVKRFETLFTSWGTQLVDLNALHEIYNNATTSKKVFLIAGAAHVYNVAAMLPKLGWERIFSTGIREESIETVVTPLRAMTNFDFMMHNDQAFNQAKETYETKLQNEFLKHLSKIPHRWLTSPPKTQGSLENKGQPRLYYFSKLIASNEIEKDIQKTYQKTQMTIMRLPCRIYLVLASFITIVLKQLP